MVLGACKVGPAWGFVAVRCGIKPVSPVLQGRFLSTGSLGSLLHAVIFIMTLQPDSISRCASCRRNSDFVELFPCSSPSL